MQSQPSLRDRCFALTVSDIGYTYPRTIEARMSLSSAFAKLQSTAISLIERTRRMSKISCNSHLSNAIPRPDIIRIHDPTIIIDVRWIFAQPAFRHEFGRICPSPGITSGDSMVHSDQCLTTSAIITSMAISACAHLSRHPSSIDHLASWRNDPSRRLRARRPQSQRFHNDGVLVA